ncbi:MAG: HAD-IA family hydrolase [Pseudomonadota bacterium]|jgi:putative hydrolase of the HAD superfamily|nr:HAD-IA family hydrolase [Candidatus Neomarinimicrobiota bacterium]MEC9074431.1 HAD-IA family hydrolase [Pseudomonadota bacterium]MEC9097729.1 HAD-IA family hydrolase [Pseudomonadota bacterium]MED5254429.1 HAD-IA family hydrolase [Pseudomonadota bacterium]|tara:strand:+ start:2763 stop:3377 length:615 start_codon:yes stop_codon:yes gene_type:complete
MKYKAIIWDFGGVITSSPFEAFNQFEEANGLPKDIIRTINSENPDTNAWAKFESNSITIDVFNDLFLKEAKAKGFDIKGRDIIKLLKGSIRKNMVSFLRELKSDFKLGCITNNVKSSSEENNDNETKEAMSLFDHVIESSIVGIRKPNPEIYMMSCDALKVSPDQCIYLDDLGINLKPARELGMTTIKVIQPEDAIQEVRNLLK